jgi:hypothetical protein
MWVEGLAHAIDCKIVSGLQNTSQIDMRTVLKVGSDGHPPWQAMCCLMPSHLLVCSSVKNRLCQIDKTGW